MKILRIIFFVFLSIVFIMLFILVSVEYQLLLVTGIGSWIGITINNNLNKEKEFKLKQFDKKAEVYKKIFNIYLDGLNTNKEDAFKLKEEMLVWCSQEVIDIAIEITNVPDTDNKYEILQSLADNLVLAMRKDLGHLDKKNSRIHEFTKSIIDQNYKVNL